MSQPNRPSLWRRWVPLIAAGVVIGVVAGAGGVALYRELGDRPGACDTRHLITKVQPSLVSIGATDAASSSSGVIIQADGVILTRVHNLADVIDHVSVGLPNGEQVPATVVGTDMVSDLAVLKIARTQLPALPLAWNQDLQLGDPVVALGSPLSSTPLATATVNAVDRRAGSSLTGLLQLTVPLSPALSGSAVVTCEGQLVGIGEPGNTGISYATNAALARRISQELLDTGRATHPWLGLTTVAVTADIASRYHSAAGLAVQAIDSGQPAENARLAVGDVITSINGRPATYAVWTQVQSTAKIGDTVRLDYVRNGQTTKVVLDFVEQPVE